jgi:hypothetical protein
MLLKRPHRVVEAVVEDIERHVLSGAEIFFGAVEMSQRDKRRPNLGDRSAAVTKAQRLAGAAMRMRNSKASGELAEQPCRLLTGLAVLSQTLGYFGKTPGKSRRTVAN